MAKNYNFNLTKYIAIIIVVLVLVIYYAYHVIQLYKSKTEAFDTSGQMLLSKIDAKFGDILLFSANGKDMYLQFYNMSLFTHCGMVVELGNQLYVMEANADRLYRAKDKLGYNTTLNSLEDRIQNYNGQVYIMKLNKELEPEMKIKILELLKNRKFKFPYSIVGAVRCLFSQTDRYFHCYGMVNYMLNSIGLMKRKGFLDASKYINDIEGKDLGKNYKYINQILIVPDMLELCRNKVCQDREKDI